MCPEHPDRTAVAACLECARLLCTECVRRDEDGLAVCEACLNGPAIGYTVSRPQYPAPTTDRNDLSGRPYEVEDVVSLGEAPNRNEQRGEDVPVVPWEDDRHPSDVRAFFKTVRLGLTRPVDFMQRIPWDRGTMTSPLIFAVLAGMLGQLGLTVSMLINPEPVKKALAEVPELAHISPSTFVLFMIPFIPLAVALGLFFKSWIAHTLLMLIGAASRPYEATFRVFAYAEVSTVFLLIPVLGPFAQKFYLVFLVLNGLRAGHGASLTAGIIALLPMLAMQMFGG